MKPLWKQLLYLHGHALPVPLAWRADAAPPPAARRPTPPMLRWREALRAALIG